MKRLKATFGGNLHARRTESTNKARAAAARENGSLSRTSCEVARHAALLAAYHELPSEVRVAAHLRAPQATVRCSGWLDGNPGVRAMR